MEAACIHVCVRIDAFPEDCILSDGFLRCELGMGDPSGAGHTFAATVAGL